MNEETLFHAALGKPPPERAAFLAAACSDIAMRQRVEVLLQAHESAGSFLQGGAAEILDPCTSDVTHAETETSGSIAHELTFLAPSLKPGCLGRLGHYEIQEVIGKGGFGTVLRAFDEKLHRVVAIKVLAPELAASATARNRFIREARAAAAITHDHVVTIHVVDEEHRPPYLVMQLIDGMTLQQKLDKGGALSLKEILRIGVQMAEGLAAAHKQGLVHRDIKPANVLLENGVERVKITDFGLAKVADDAAVTQSGVVAGTPTYMSPEQANGLVIDHRSDLFSLGTVLYVMCTGRPPFRASGTMAVLKRVIDDTPRPVREINPEIPDWLEAIITKLHAKKPEKRFQSARELADVLGENLSELQSAGGARRVSSPPAATPHSSRAAAKRTIAVVVATLLLAALVPLGWVGFSYFRGAPADNSPVPGHDDNLLVVLDDPSVRIVVVGEKGDNHGVIGDHRGKPGFHLPPGRYQIRGTRNAVLVFDEWITLAAGDKKTVHIDSSWTQLFNGKDLEGWDPWRITDGEWKVEDRVLVGRNAPGYLFSARPYENFHLRVEAKINADGWGGLAFRHTGESHGNVALCFKRGKSGSLHYFNKGKNQLLQEPEKQPASADTWLNLELIVQGRNAVVLLNGAKTAEASIDGLPDAGPILLCADAPGTVIHFRKIEIKELPTRTPEAATPFAVLAKGGKAERKFATLSDAMTAAQAGDTIEIRGDGPFVCEPIKLYKKELRIKAKEGFQPVIRLKAADVKPEAALFDTQARLILEGLILELESPEIVPKTHPYPRIVYSLKAPVHVANCRFSSLQSPCVAILAVESHICEVRNCHFFCGNKIHCAVDWNVGNRENNLVIIDNSLLAGGFHGLVVNQNENSQPGGAIYLQRNTLAVANPINLAFYAEAPGALAKGSPTGKPLRMEVNESIFAGPIYCILGFSQVFKVAEATDSMKADKALARLLSWREQSNLFPKDVVFLKTSSNLLPKGPTFSLKTPVDWQRFWKLTDQSFLEGTARFQIGDLTEKTTATPSDLSPGGFRLVKGSPGQGVLPGGKDLGVDVEFLGPGAAYERWQKTPEYQEWLKKTGVAEPGWVQLFNGKDLDGWNLQPVDKDVWRVKDGILIGQGSTVRSAAECSMLPSERADFRDFHLRVEAMINEGGNSGVWVRVDLESQDGYEVNINHSHRDPARTGSLGVKKNGIQKWLHSQKKSPVPANTWFTLEVIAAGSDLTVKIDSMIVAQVRDTTRGAGHIRLEIFEKDSVVQFRRIEIRELAPGAAVAPFNAAKAKDHQDAWAKHLGVEPEIANSIGMKLRLIPPGEFLMGSSAEEIAWLLKHAPDLKDAPEHIKDNVRSEGPQRRATVKEPFYMGMHEVTVGQFREFVRATKHRTEAEAGEGGVAWNDDIKKWERKPEHVWDNAELSGGDTHPVVFVTLADAQAFCVWLTKQEGRAYALPAEDQWEWACRAGATAYWFFGDNPALMKDFGWTTPLPSKRRPVGSLAPNPFGLYDIYGNVQELTIGLPETIARGGQAGESAYRARSASRVGVGKQYDPSVSRGFRVVGDLHPKTPPAKR